MHAISTFHIASDDLEPVFGGVQVPTPRDICRYLGPQCTLVPSSIPGPFIPYIPFLVFD